MTAVMAGLLFRVERLKAVQIAGILVGILGVVVIIAPWQGLDLSQSLVAQFAILGATACYGFSLAYMRKFVSNTGMTRARVLVPEHRHRRRDHARCSRPWSRSRRSRSTRGSSAACSCSDASAPASRTSGTRTRSARGARPARRPSPTSRRSSASRSASSILGETISWNEPVGALVVFLGILLAPGDRILMRRDPGDRHVAGFESRASADRRTRSITKMRVCPPRK